MLNIRLTLDRLFACWDKQSMAILCYSDLKLALQVKLLITVSSKPSQLPGSLRVSLVDQCVPISCLSCCHISIIHTRYCLLSCDMFRELEYFICSRNMIQNLEERTEKEGKTPKSTYKVRGHPTVTGMASV